MKDRLNGMRVFAQVVESRSFVAAADKLGMSKSLVSRHVSALEDSLAVKLLNRTTRRLSLTEAGAVFYEHCARIVQEAELAEKHLSETQADPSGLVKVTATPGFAVRHVLPALTDFYKQYPKIRVQLSCSNRLLELGEAGFDLGIRVSFNPEANLVARKLAVNSSVLCATPAYLKQHGTPRRIEDLGDKNKVSIPVSGSFETDDMDAVRAAVITGMGIGILPTYMVSDALRQGQLVPLLRKYRVVPESAIYLVYLPNRTMSSRLRALIDFLVERFGPVPPWEMGW